MPTNELLCSIRETSILGTDMLLMQKGFNINFNKATFNCYREYLLEVKVRLLEQLSCGFNSPQLAIEFIQMLLDEYSALCVALPALLYLLEPLVSCLYIVSNLCSLLSYSLDRWLTQTLI